MRQEPLHKPFKHRRAIKLAKAIKVLLDGRYVTDQCSSVVAGPLQARPIRIYSTGASNADLIALEPPTQPGTT